jgi:hypothetical protein
MRAPLLPSGLVAGLALLPLLAGGCNQNQTDEFPASVGFQPVEAVTPSAAWPAPTVADSHPQGLGPIVPVPEDGHYASHARGYLHAPLVKVYLALHDPAASYLHNSGGGTRLDGSPTLGVEPFPVSFRVRYANSVAILGEVKYEVTYRAGPLEGTEAAPTVIGERYQKTWGTSHIGTMTGSLVATAVEGAPDVTSVEMVAWLQATTQYQSDCDGTLRDLFGDLEAVLASLP